MNEGSRSLKVAVIVTFLSLILFFVPNIPPREFWYCAFLSLLIPALLLLLVFLLVYWSIKRKWIFLVPLALLLVNWKYIQRTVSFSIPKENADFSVLSYNVRVFNVYPQFADEYFASSKKTIALLNKSDADIVCVQEYYNDSKDTLFNTLSKVKKTYPHNFYNITFTNTAGGTFGMVIFSKYPILSKGKVIFNERSNNQILYADIVLPKDTVRVYNMHLQSMNINEEEIIDGDFDKSYKNKMIQALLKYKYGTISRSRQVDKLIKHIRSSPYKVIVCGDLNDPPYSYTYEQLSEVLNNAFEEKGNGFGFTFNGKLPFLRIDQQFADPNLRIQSFDTKSNETYTDHFPIQASYSFK